MVTRFHELLRLHLEKQSRSFYWLQENLDISTALSTRWKKTVSEGGRRPSINDIKKLASSRELDLSEDTLMAWRATDEYTLQQLQGSIACLLEHPELMQ